MKKLLFGFFLSVTYLLLSQTVNGDLQEFNDRKVLTVWGTHEERGFAQGFILAESLQDIMKNYIISYVYSNNSTMYQYARNYFEAHFEVDTDYVTEATAIISGMESYGIDLYSNVLGRNLDSTDILMASSITDLSAISMLNEDLNLGCSSISSWAEATEEDQQLQGHLVITRNMDWTPHAKLLENHLLLVHLPSETDEVPWASFSFPGFMGALSGINESGLAAFKNVGNYNSHPNPENVHPVLLTIRKAIESDDYNNDGFVTPDDLENALQDHNRLAGSIIHTVFADYGVIFECNNANGVVRRTIAENQVEPVINGNNLVATNHFRLLYQPVNCYRYEDFADSLNISDEMTMERSWDVASGAGGVAHNLHTIQYIPSMQKCFWSVATTDNPAYQNEPVEYDLNVLFDDTSNNSNNDQIQLIQSLAFPNPFHNETSIHFSIPNSPNAYFSIYNIKGQKMYSEQIKAGKRSGMITWNGKDMNQKKVRSGVYLYQVKVGTQKHSGKLLFLQK